MLRQLQDQQNQKERGIGFFSKMGRFFCIVNQTSPCDFESVACTLSVKTYRRKYFIEVLQLVKTVRIFLTAPALPPAGFGAVTASPREAFWPNLLCRGRVLNENCSGITPVPSSILFLVTIKIYHQYIFTVLVKSLYLQHFPSLQTIEITQGTSL